MKAFKRIAVIVLLAAMTFGMLGVRAGAAPEYNTLEGDLTASAKYGNVTVSIPLSEMAASGYEIGDVLTVSFLGKTVDAPFCSNYPDVDAGSVGALCAAASAAPGAAQAKGAPAAGRGVQAAGHSRLMETPARRTRTAPTEQRVETCTYSATSP